MECALGSNHYIKHGKRVNSKYVSRNTNLTRNLFYIFAHQWNVGLLMSGAVAQMESKKQTTWCCTVFYQKWAISICWLYLVNHLKLIDIINDDRSWSSSLPVVHHPNRVLQQSEAWININQPWLTSINFEQAKLF